MLGKGDAVFIHDIPSFYAGSASDCFRAGEVVIHDFFPPPPN